MWTGPARPTRKTTLIKERVIMKFPPQETLVRPRLLIGKVLLAAYKRTIA